MINNNNPRRGNGNYQKKLDSITKLKILHYLSVKPYSYHSLWDETHIQRNRLRKILDNFTETGVLISHKYKWNIDYFNTNNICDAKNALTYYVLNLDNEEALRWLTNIPLDTYVKDIYRSLILKEELQKVEKEMKRRRMKFNATTDDPGSSLEEFKIVKNMDYLFLPWIYLSENEKLNYNQQYFKYSFFEPLIDKSKIPAPLQDLYDNSKFLYNANSESKQYLDQIRYHAIVRYVLSLSKRHDLSKYDILIHLSYLNPTRVNYLFLWHAIRKY
jgi:hypothetical protein